MKKLKLALAALLAFASVGNADTKVFIDPVVSNYPTNMYSIATFYDTSTMSLVDIKVVFFPKDNSILTSNDAIAYVKAAAYTEAGIKGYTITDSDFISNWPITGIPLPPSYANPTRTLNSAFQISATRPATVSYSVDVACTATLTGGATGTVFLEYADDSAFTTNVVEIGRSTNANTVSLAIAITVGQTITSNLYGIVPAGKYVRLRTSSTVGSPTYTFRSSQEVLQ